MDRKLFVFQQIETDVIIDYHLEMLKSNGKNKIGIVFVNEVKPEAI
jgi:hypothetical protein